jgi:hypothetical protein
MLPSPYNMLHRKISASSNNSSKSIGNYINSLVSFVIVYQCVVVAC